MPAKARSHSHRRRPGPPRKPRSSLAAELQKEVAATSARRRHISAKQRAWIAHYVDAGCRNPIESATAVGFTRPLIGEQLVTRLADLIEAERLRRSMGQQMEIDEALSLVAAIARGDAESKVRHAALRTVLEVHGVLSGKAIVDRREQMRSIHQLVAAIKEKIAKGGGKGKVMVRATERVLEAEMGGEEGSEPAETEIVDLVPTKDKD